MRAPRASETALREAVGLGKRPRGQPHLLGSRLRRTAAEHQSAAAAGGRRSALSRNHPGPRSRRAAVSVVARLQQPCPGAGHRDCDRGELQDPAHSVALPDTGLPVRDPPQRLHGHPRCRGPRRRAEHQLLAGHARPRRGAGRRCDGCRSRAVPLQSSFFIEIAALIRRSIALAKSEIAPRHAMKTPESAWREAPPARLRRGQFFAEHPAGREVPNARGRRVLVVTQRNPLEDRVSAAPAKSRSESGA